jgi:hypothetical protein
MQPVIVFFVTKDPMMVFGYEIHIARPALEDVDLFPFRLTWPVGYAFLSKVSAIRTLGGFFHATHLSAINAQSSRRLLVQRSQVVALCSKMILGVVLSETLLSSEIHDLDLLTRTTRLFGRLLRVDSFPHYLTV